MNQFSNIGSMFPGAQHKELRDKLKQLLTMPGNRQITGLVLTDEKSDIIIVNGDNEKVAITFFRLDPHGPKTLEAKWLDPKCWEGCQSLVLKEAAGTELKRVVGIARAEYTYWKGVCDKDPGGYGIEGMGAAANIVAGLLSGISVEEYKAGKADKESIEIIEDDAIKNLREKWDEMLIQEVRVHGGIPELTQAEREFREAMAAFLLERSPDESQTSGS